MHPTALTRPPAFQCVGVQHDSHDTSKAAKATIRLVGKKYKIVRISRSVSNLFFPHHQQTLSSPFQPSSFGYTHLGWSGQPVRFILTLHSASKNQFNTMIQATSLLNVAILVLALGAGTSQAFPATPTQHHPRHYDMHVAVQQRQIATDLPAEFGSADDIWEST